MYQYFVKLLCLLFSVFILYGQEVDLNKLTLPPGFSIQFYVDGLIQGARSLTLGGNTENGGTIVYLSAGRCCSFVYALIDDDKDGFAEKKVVVIDNQENPFGIAYKNGSLWVAQRDTRILRYDNVDQLSQQGLKFNEPTIIRDDLPINEDPIQNLPHRFRYISFGPDNKLYVSIGAPGDLGEIPPSSNPLFPYGSIVRMDPDGKNVETVATGIRNNVGLEFHPENQLMYYSNNEANLLGDDFPDDVLYVVDLGEGELPKDGGFPYCHVQGEGQADLREPGKMEIIGNEELNQFGESFNCLDFNIPIQALGPHVAPLGMRFKSGSMFPSEFDDVLFIARHGSAPSSRADRIGFDVVSVKLDQSGKKVLDFQKFVSGWFDENNNEPSGRPADILFLPDGSMLVSDDYAKTVYRITYSL